MKKTRTAVATLTAAVFAVGCFGALAACNEKPEEPEDKGYKITFDANGGTYTGNKTTVELTTDENGRIAAKPSDPSRTDYTFNGYTVKKDGTGDAITFGASGYQFTAASTVYAQWTANEPTPGPGPTPGPSENEFTITLEVGEGTLPDGAAATLTTVDGKLTALPTPVAPTKKSFTGWYMVVEAAEEQPSTPDNEPATVDEAAPDDGQDDPVVQYEEVTTETVFEKDTTIYAQYRDEFAVTLHVGADGALPEGTETEYITVDGKLPLTFLPFATTTKENYQFWGWYTSETGGTEVDIDKVYTADTDIYARVAQKDGVWKSTGELVYELSVNTGATGQNDPQLQYWLGNGKKMYLLPEDVVSIYIDGQLMTYTIKQNSTGIEVPNASARVTSVKITENARFKLYVNKWGENNWQCEFTGTPNNPPEVTNEAPAGIPVTVTAGNGVITFYFIAPDGTTAITADNAGDYQIHGWQDSNGNIFGQWANNPTLDGSIVVEDDLDEDTNFMFHWATAVGGKTQTNAIGNISINKTYIINLKDDSVKEYVPAENND